MTSSEQPGDRSRAVERLQRLLMPRRGEPVDVRSLYVEETARAAERLRFDDRFRVWIAQGGEVSFETYFNAFPASYWRRWTQLDSVVLRLHVEGSGRVDVYRSRIDGGRIAVDSADVVDDAVEFELSLAPFESGGWYWFDVTAETDVIVRDGGWYAPCAPGPQRLPDGGELPPREGRVAVGIPTFNRPADAVAALEALASDPEVDAAIDAVLMPDQGTAHPADEPGYAAVTAHFGDRFHEYRQGNLGGSGGYARIMHEALAGEVTDAPFILYMDDDIAIEPDSVLRAVQIARYATTPFLVGGQMLNLLNRSELRTMGEVVDRSDFMWAPAPHVHYDHDFARHPLSDLHDQAGDGRTSRSLHRRIDVEFNGWWMCLIPRVVAERIGRPLPLFIKWDDTEYSLRAAAAGFPTVTWPGVAIWHMSWADKDDAIDWQAYFHLRNRLIVAALHHDGGVRGLIAGLWKSAFKHLMCMEYSTLAIQLKAMDDFLAGPDHLFGILDSALGEVNAIRRRYPDARVVPSAKDLPAAAGAPADVPLYDRGGVTQKPRKVGWLLKGVRNNLRRPDPALREVPQLNLTPEQARWYSLSRLDSATVTTAGNNGVVLRRRDREEAARLLRETARRYREVARRFDEMRRVWREAAPRLASGGAWGEVFDAQ